MKSYLTITFLMLTGCTTHWVKPGASHADFQRDKSECHAQAYSRFPAQYSSGSSRTKTTCSPSGLNQVQCNSQADPTVIDQMNNATDQNDYPRSQAIRSCFFSKGWTVRKD